MRRWRIRLPVPGYSSIDGPPTGNDAVEVIPASYTEEDVERVAEALWDKLPAYNKQASYDEAYETMLRAARAALSAFLKP